ncbi:MAG: molybdenum hydroxylase, partial [Lachnospiraceae bacterium]
LVPIVQIGELVEVGQVVAVSGKTPIKAQISGMIRGMLQPGLMVEKGMKCGDIDPRCDIEQCMTVSDKARAVGGGVLEAIYRKENSKE